jgi:parallel beta-helix repeat protein
MCIEVFSIKPKLSEEYGCAGEGRTLFMDKKTAPAIMLTLLLTSMLTLAINIQPVKASGTIYIRADGSIEPITAKITSMDNVTYTFTNNNYDSIVIQRNNIVVDGAGYTVQGTGAYPSKGIDLTGRINITVKNIKIEKFYYGIWLNMSLSNSIHGNNIGNNYDGIELTDSSNNNRATGNNITANNYGVVLSSSSNNSIDGNNITANIGAGMILTGSSNSSISGNKIANNDYGVYVYSSSNSNSLSENNITANKHYGVIIDSSSNNTISGNNIGNNYDGIELTDSSNNTLRRNVAAYNKYNFHVWGENLSDFLNDIDASNTVGSKPIYYWINKRDSEIPPDAGYVALVNCTRIIVQNLNLTNNWQGALLAYTTNSTIAKNNITSNMNGIHLCESSNNSIYHNNFVNNSQQVLIQYGHANVWDNSYPSGGNYWSEYTSVDLFRGLHQNVTGSDGIGDTAYTIDASNKDGYPLTKPYGGPHDIGITSMNTSNTTVGQGYNLKVNVKIINYGISLEAFNVTAYANTTLIARLNINLAGRNSTTITLTWNVTGFAKGNYSMKAIADTVPGETDTTDNMFVDGWVFVLSSGHDVAVRSLASRPVVGGGYTSPFNVTAMNVGKYTETFNVTVYINGTSIASQNVTLSSGNSTTIIFTWNTSGFALGNYAISAYAGPVPGETDTADNNYSGGWILAAMVGDLGSGPPPTFFACDREVDAIDFTLWKACYDGVAPPNAMYLGDLGRGPPPTFYTSDGVVDSWDYALWKACYDGLGPNP